MQRPVVIFGSLTTVRNQARIEPLETTDVVIAGSTVRVPTKAEILRIKSWLIVRRNATRDFLDVAAIASMLTESEILVALAPMDRLYPQAGDPGGVRQQLMRQLALPRPFDLDTLKLDEYRGLVPEWQDWSTVVDQCQKIATLMARAVATRRTGWVDLAV